MKLIIKADYRGERFQAEEIRINEDGSFCITKFIGQEFSPDSEHVENITINEFQ